MSKLIMQADFKDTIAKEQWCLFRRKYADFSLKVDTFTVFMRQEHALQYRVHDCPRRVLLEILLRRV